ncbi:sulfite oxidase [Microlunatus aurantiacus]|uniref:Sulfite oxidase n=2 Tax=Microlunatus aurantiacus TaxID=446786 RepID=A0ABP7CFV0_9ACTN
MIGMGKPRKSTLALSGVLSASAALGVGHLVAALMARPAASPLIAVGSVAVDAAPTPVKETAVRLLGTWDKPVLISGIAVVLLVAAAGIGLLARHRPGPASVAIGALGLVGAGAALLRSGFSSGGVWSAVPSLVAGVVGVVALTLLTRSLTPPDLTSRTAADSPTIPTGSRRRFLATVAGAGLLAAAGAGLGEAVNRTRQAARGLIRLPLPRSAAKPLPFGVQVPGVQTFTTPDDAFYRVDISLVTPRVDVGTWTLTIDGGVDRPLVLSYDDLLAMPMIERDITLACVSNEVGGAYVSSARWLGVPFSEILTRVGVRPGVDQVFSYSSDSGYTCSTPLAAVSDGRDAMIAVGMNGVPLPDAHGFPARMVVPGLFGFVSATKWLERIEFTSYAAQTAYWTERGWATDAPVLTQSKIEVPASLGTLSASGMIGGTAWAQHRGIDRVEIRIDDGKWQDVTLAESAGIDTWRQWSFHYDGPAGRHTAQVRATDGTGEVQPENRTKVFPSGARGWHQIQFSVE